VVTGNKQMEWNLSSISLREITISFFIKKTRRRKKLLIGLGLKISKYSSKKPGKSL
jgi:hypothetical protein